MPKSFNLFPYQQEAVERHLQILDSVGASLDGTGCGGGKTVIASALAARYGLPVGVICPKSVIHKWDATLAAFNVRPLFILNPEMLRTGRTPFLSKTKTARGKIEFRWNFPSTPLLIFDEAHVFGAHNSQNGKLLESAAPYPTLMLSATAAESPLKMRALGVQLRLFSSWGFWKWVKDMGAEQNAWGGMEWNPLLFENKAKMERLHASVFTSRGYRVPESVLRAQLPELMVEDEPLSLTPAQRKAIRDLYSQMADATDPGGVKNLRQRQSAELVKVPVLVDRAKELVESGASVVLFLNFHESIDAAEALFDGAAGVIDGRRKMEDRHQTQESFQNNALNVVVVQIAAGGQSIDLHDTHGDRPRVALICPQFSGLAEEQAIGRISRVGAKSRALAIRLYVEGTVEEHAVMLTQEKRENVAIFNSGKNSLNAQQGSGVSSSMPDVITPQPAEREHSEHSPSSLKEKAKCPGWRNDPNRDTSATDRGTLGHRAVEEENLDIIPPEDFQLRDAAKMCINYTRRLPQGMEIRERRYPVQDQFGHIDLVILHDGIAELVDYKFAWGQYEANSPQFWAYAVSLWDAHPEVETVRVHVLLPFQGVIDIEEWTREKDYERLSAAVAAIISAAKRDNPADYQTGSHCAWCARKADCPKLNTLALTIASKYKHEELTIPAKFDPANITDPNMIALCKKAAPIMKSWAEKVDERALEMRLREGIEIPGWELAERKLPFKITDAQAAWETVKRELSPEAFAACAEIRIGELEKAIARVSPRGEKGKAAAKLRDALIDANAARSEGSYNYLKKSRE
jgi:hypothetical protein